MQRANFLLNVPADLLKSGSNREYVTVTAVKFDNGVIDTIIGTCRCLLKDLIDVDALCKLSRERAVGYFPERSTSFVNQNGELCLQN
jgi:hypothetical protein